MKKYLLIIIVLTVALTGCESLYDPDARFEASKVTVIPYEEIQFYNHSKYAEDYEWSFGDGMYSNDFEPYHYYTEPGTYEVKLSAFKGEEVSDAYMTINVIAPDLNILVREFSKRYVVPNAKVILYPTLLDWDSQTNVTAYAYTNSEGIVEFYNLPEGFYYMDISNSTHDNYTLANEDIGYIKTPFISNETTYITAYVDYVGNNTMRTKTKRATTTVVTKRPYSSEMSAREDK